MRAYICLSIFPRSVFGSPPAQTLPSCLLPYLVCYPERLITRLKGAFKGWSILRDCSTVCVHCQVLVGAWADQPGRSAKQCDSGFDKHRLVRWNGCAPRWPALSSVYSVCSSGLELLVLSPQALDFSGNTNVSQSELCL